MYNIVTSDKLIPYIQKSRHYKVDLGKRLSVVDENKNKKFAFDELNLFSQYYVTKYNAIPYVTGWIGSLCFFKDFQMKSDIMMLFYKNKEFIYDFDFEYVDKNGFEKFLSEILSDIETNYSIEIENAQELSKEMGIGIANPDKLVLNPANVTYDDILAWKKNKGK